MVEPELAAFSVFLLFCRIGGCVVLAPGLSSARVPLQVRLLVALALVLATSPLLSGMIEAGVSDIAEIHRPILIISESTTGLLIGLMGRMFLIGLQFAANVVSGTIGLAGIPGIPLEEGETGSPLATLASSAATMTVLALGLHVEMLRAVIDSYAVIALGSPIEPAVMLGSLTTVLAETTMLALRLSAPFIAYGLTINITLGLANRFVPQVSVYHATTGTVILIGLFLLCHLWPEWMMVFIDSYSAWLQRGGF